MLVDISDVWAMPGTICACFSFSGMPAVSRLHLCVDLSFDLSGTLMEMGLLAGCTFFTGFPGRTTYLVAPLSAMASCLDIYTTDVEYAVSIFLLVWLLTMIVLLSSSSLVASSANLIVVLFVLG